MEALKKVLIAAALVAALSSCTAGVVASCSEGVDRELMSTGTCGSAVTVTVKSGRSCIPSAFTGFNSALAGFPAGTNDDHPVLTDVPVEDGGRESRRCVLASAGDAGFTVSCDRCSGVDADGGCNKVGSCKASLVP